MKYPADVVKVYPSRKIALLQKLIPACAVLLYQLLVAGISYRLFRYLFEWNYAMEVVNYYVDFDQGDFYFTAKKFRHTPSLFFSTFTPLISERRKRILSLVSLLGW